MHSMHRRRWNSTATFRSACFPRFFARSAGFSNSRRWADERMSSCGASACGPITRLKLLPTCRCQRRRWSRGTGEDLGAVIAAAMTWVLTSRGRSLAARYSVLKGIATESDGRALRGNAMAWSVRDIEGKHMVAAVGFYRWMCCGVAGHARKMTLASRWLHTWVNSAARRRISQLISSRRSHHQLVVAFNSLKHQGIPRPPAFDV